MKIAPLFIILLSGILCFARKPSPIIYPPEEQAALNMKIYMNYFLYSEDSVTRFHKLAAGDELIIAPNCSVYVAPNLKKSCGTWRINNDTLLIYQNWHEWETNAEDIEEDILNNNSIQYDIRLWYTFLHSRKIDDLTFPRNVSAFRIINNGDSLIALADENRYKGGVISKKAVHESHLINNKGNYKGNYPYNYVLFHCEDTLIWKPKLMPASSQFVVEDIAENGSRPVMVTVRTRGIAFNILNPRYYPQPEAKPFDSKPYTAWFDSVAVGDTIALALSRPAYTRDVFDRSPYLRGYPDTIYVMDYEAYGYWFGRHITEKEHIRPLAIPAQLPIHRIYDGQPSIRIPVRQPHHRKRMRMVPYNQQ